MHVARRILDFDQLPTHSSPQQWLSAAEWARYCELRGGPASRTWLAGRWCAKQAVSELLNEQSPAMHMIHIESRDGAEQRIAPRVFVEGRLQSVHLSLTHGRQVAAAMATSDPTRSVGVDVVDLTTEDRHLTEYWFTEREQAWCASGVSPLAVWSLKEALYKAVGNGMAFAPQQVNTAQWVDWRTLNKLASEPHGTQQHESLCVYWQRETNELVVLVEVHGYRGLLREGPLGVSSQEVFQQ